jgi:hypothetical protein
MHCLITMINGGKVMFLNQPIREGEKRGYAISEKCLLYENNRSSKIAKLLSNPSGETKHV